jgi:hypothetical protein
MYQKLFQSYVWWLESRGKSRDMARLTAALVLSTEALINLGAAIMLIQAAGGPPMLDWVARHSWVTWVAAILCATAHLLLSRRVPSADIGRPATVTRV